jgi:hypothetical protein
LHIAITTAFLESPLSFGFTPSLHTSLY